MSTGKFTRQQIAELNQRRNAAIIIDNVVYDVSDFVDDHPGGREVLLDNAGKDASKCFLDVGHSEIALEWRKQFVIGEVVDADRWPVLVREVPQVPEAEPMTLGAMLNVWGAPLVLTGLAVLLYMYLFP